MAYCINFQKKVEVKLYNLRLKKHTKEFTLDKHSTCWGTKEFYQFEYCFMEIPLITMYQNKLLCTLGGCTAYFFEDVYSNRKPIPFHHKEKDILRIFIDETSIGFVVEDIDSVLSFYHHDLTKNEDFCWTMSSEDILSFPRFLKTIIKVHNQYFFCDGIKDEKNGSIIHHIILNSTTHHYETYSVAQNIRGLHVEDGKVTTVGRKNISCFQLIQKRDILLPLFKGAVESTFGTVHENIDVKRYIFEFLVPDQQA